MNEHDRKVLCKILTHAEHILRYTEALTTQDDFESDEKTVEACVFNMMQIGELSHSELSDACKSMASSIPWNQIYGMRNRIVHGYGEVRLDIVWETIERGIPDLKTEIEQILRHDVEVKIKE